jgi:leader peptidase (prepilin peptidase) / N-methyltransferase
MNPVWAAGGATIGLMAATVLRSTVFRLSVPSGDPDRVACSNCAAPVQRMPALRCRGCRSSLGPGMALELVTASVLALLMGRFGGQPDLVAFSFFGALGVALSAIDIAVQRLPDRLVLPAYPVLITVLTCAATVHRDFGALVRALLGGIVLGAAFLLLGLLRPGQLGGGDVKLAGLAGLALGWLGWPALVAGAALGFLLSSVVSLALLAMRRVTLHSQICFGPFLVGGALLAMLAVG